MLSDLSELQETYRGLFRDLYKEGGADDIDEDAIVAVCVAFMEMRALRTGDPYEEATGDDVIAAIEFIDHLHTQGKAVIT